LYGGKKLLDFLVQKAEIHLQNWLARMQHHVDRSFQVAQPSSHRGPHAPADSVTLHRAPQNLAYSQADACSRLVAARAEERRKIPRKLFPAFLVHSLKIRVL